MKLLLKQKKIQLSDDFHYLEAVGKIRLAIERMTGIDFSGISRDSSTTQSVEGNVEP